MSSVAEVLPDFRALPPELIERLPQPYVVDRDLVGEEALRRLSEERARRFLGSSEFGAVALRKGDHVAGLACWGELPWDSEQFGFPAGRLEFLIAEGDYFESRAVKDALLQEVLSDCETRGLRHLIARVDAEDLSTVHALEKAGFEIIDGIQTFSARLTPDWVPPPRGAIEVRMFRETDLDSVVEIARTAYAVDRFHTDPALSSGIADALNETWVRNCCSGQAADAVIVAAEQGRVIGYVTCRTDPEAARILGVLFGSIGMVAISAGIRGHGAGTAVTFGALEWFHKQKVDVVQVGTQLRNIPASRLYQKCGFRLASVSLTFRKLLPVVQE